jgi:hypothetical protein
MYSGTGFVVEKGQASSLVPYLTDLVAAVASAVPWTAAFDSTRHRLKIKQSSTSTAYALPLKGLYGDSRLSQSCLKGFKSSRM